MKDIIPSANQLLKENLTNEEKKDIQKILAINLPIPPLDPTELPEYINYGSKLRDAMKKMAQRYIIRKSSQILKQEPNPKIYNLALDRAIECAELVLRAELSLSYYLKEIKTRQGMRTDLQEKINQSHKTKTEKIKDIFGLTPEQAKKISMLQDWAVEKAIKQGWEKREIPTRAVAIKMIKDKKRQENNKKYNPDAIYMDRHLSIREIIDLKPMRATTLFSNVGIGEFYLEYGHIKNVIAAEIDSKRVEWYKKIYPSVNIIEGDLFDKNVQNAIIKEHIAKSCKLIIATPPCQTLSVAGKRDFTNIKTKLFIPMLEVIKGVDEINDYVLIENVPQYMTASPKNLQYILNGKTIAEYIKSELEKLNYEVNIDKINAANYGTAQSRERMILLASKKGIWKFPLPFNRQKTLMEAIGDLPSLEAGEEDTSIPYHKAPCLKPHEIEFLKHTPTGCSAWDNSDEYKPKNKDKSLSQAKHKRSFSRESWSKPASTITSDSDDIGGHNTIHPGRPVVDEQGNITWSDARVYTLAEKLILLGFAQTWEHGIPGYVIPDGVSNQFINTVLAESFLPRLAVHLVETIPNRTAHPDENIDNYPKKIEYTEFENGKDKDSEFTVVFPPVLDFELRLGQDDQPYIYQENEQDK